MTFAINSLVWEFKELVKVSTVLIPLFESLQTVLETRQSIHSAFYVRSSELRCFGKE